MERTIYTDVVVVGAGLTTDIQPPADEVQEVTILGSSVWIGVAPNSKPNMNVGLFDTAIGPSLFLRGADIRGWNRTQHLIIDNTNYLRLTNAAGAGANLSWGAKVIRRGGATIVRSDLQTVGAGLTYSLQPVVGEDIVVRDFCSDQWVGAAPAGLPNLNIDLDNGTLTARMMQSSDTAQWEPEMELYITNANYITITNAAGVQAVIGFSAEVIREYGAGISVVQSDVVACLAGASVDFQPPAGEEWEVTMIGGVTWAGAPPLAFPNITAHLFDGTNASMIMDQNNWILHGSKPSIIIDNNNYLRITDTSAAGMNVAISAIMTGQYA